MWGTFFQFFFARFLCLLVPSSAFVVLHAGGRVDFACHGHSLFFDCILFSADSARGFDPPFTARWLEHMRTARFSNCMPQVRHAPGRPSCGWSRSEIRVVHPCTLRRVFYQAILLVHTLTQVRRNMSQIEIVLRQFQGTGTCQVMSP